MLTLNILPNKVKKQNQLKGLYNSLNRLLIIVIFVTAIYSTFLYIEKMMLTAHFTEAQRQTEVSTKSSGDYLERVSEINNKIDYINTINEDSVLWSDFLLEMSSVKPDGVTFSNISIARQNKTLRLSGHAKSRDDLLRLKEQLENQSFLEEVNLPLNTLFEKENINFEISAMFKNYEFAKK